MQLCVPLRIIFGGGAEVDATGVGVTVAERSCGNFDILERLLRQEIAVQFSAVEYRELQVTFLGTVVQSELL
jgi:hypothetical protein